MTLKKAINSPNQEKDFADKELTHTHMTNMTNIQEISVV